MKAEDCDALLGIANQLRGIVFPTVAADAMPAADRIAQILVRASNEIVEAIYGPAALDVIRVEDLADQA